MKRILYFLSLVLALSTVGCASDNSADPTTIGWKRSVDHPEKMGLSAPFAGVVDGRTLMTAGGCNFPDVAAKDGGVKVFSDKIYLLENGQWRLSDERLPSARAYGVSIPTKDGVYMIGGTADGRTSLGEVLLYSKGKLLKTAFDMPIALDNMGGALIGDKIYITGGLNDGVPNNRAFVFNLTKNSWSEIDPYPGLGRVQPIVVAQNAAEEARVYLLGGFDPISKTVLTDGWAYSPKDKRWTAVAPAPAALNGGIGFQLGVHTILATGGVNREIFTEGLLVQGDSARYAYMNHEPEWYRFNDTLWAYNTIVDRWCSTGEIAHGGLAGAAFASIPSTGEYYVIMGETMPGVRTPQVLVGEVESVRAFGAVNWTVIAIYLLAMIGLGLFFMLRTKTSDEYFNGGGKIPWWAVSVSIFATMLSAITFMAIPAKTYATDWRYFLMAFTIFIVAFPVVKYYLPFFRRLNITSAYEYLELRFNSTTRVMSSLLFIVFMTARMALVLYLPSLALTAATGIDVYTCILLMSLITIVYSSIGGIQAVVWGDVVQGIILMGGAIFTVVYIMMHTDGDFLQIALDADKFRLLDFSPSVTTASIWVVVLGGFAIQLISYTSDQTVIQRYLTVSSEKKAAKSIITNGILSVVSSFLFYLMGTALFAYFQSRPETLDIAMPTADSIFPFYIMSQLPVGLAGLLIAAIFAASMSTVSSNINSIATAFTVDIYGKIKPNASEKARFRSARFSSVIFGILGCGFALMMATWNVLSLFDWFNTMLGILTSGLGALFFIGIFFDRVDGRSALLGFVLGNVGLILVTLYTPIFFLLYGLIGIVLITCLSLMFSYILPRKVQSNNGLTWKKLNEKR